ETKADAKVDKKSPVKISIQQRQKDRIRSIIQRPASISKSADAVETSSSKDTSQFSINTTNAASGSTATASSTSSVPASPSNKQKSNSTPTTPTTPMSPTRDYHGSHQNRRRDRDRDKRHSLEARPVIKILSKSSNANKEGTSSSTPAATNAPTGSR